MVIRQWSPTRISCRAALIPGITWLTPKVATSLPSPGEVENTSPFSKRPTYRMATLPARVGCAPSAGPVAST